MGQQMGKGSSNGSALFKDRYVSWRVSSYWDCLSRSYWSLGCTFDSHLYQLWVGFHHRRAQLFYRCRCVCHLGQHLSILSAASHVSASFPRGDQVRSDAIVETVEHSLGQLIVLEFRRIVASGYQCTSKAREFSCSWINECWPWVSQPCNMQGYQLCTTLIMDSLDDMYTCLTICDHNVHWEMCGWC